ncbi:LEM domain-containing protein 1 isoform 2-T3 [Lycaon pictus]
MVDVKSLSDYELQNELNKLGFSPGPILPSTRKVYEKKLVQLLVSPPCASTVMNGPCELDRAQDDDDSEESCPRPGLHVIPCDQGLDQSSDEMKCQVGRFERRRFMYVLLTAAQDCESKLYSQAVVVTGRVLPLPKLNVTIILKGNIILSSEKNKALKKTYLTLFSQDTMLKAQRIDDHPGNGCNRASTSGLSLDSRLPSLTQKP